MGTGRPAIMMDAELGDSVEDQIPNEARVAEPLPWVQRATSFRASRYRSIYDEGTHLDESAAQVRARWHTLAIRLVVVTAGRNRDPQRLALQRDQTTLSTRGCQVIVEDSGHVVARDKPEVVVSAIRATIDASRRPDGTPCESMITPRR